MGMSKMLSFAIFFACATITAPAKADESGYVFGACRTAEFPEGFPRSFDHCSGTILFGLNGREIRIVLAPEGSKVIEKGKDEGKIVDKEGNEFSMYAFLYLSGEDYFEGDGRQITQKNGSILQYINKVEIK